jgi:hypothetical protein
MITLCILGYILISFCIAFFDHGPHWNTNMRRYEYTSWKQAIRFGFLFIPGLIVLVGIAYGLFWLAGGILVGTFNGAEWIYHNMP